MIVRLKNILHPTRILSGSSSSVVATATATTERTAKRNQLALPLNLPPSETEYYVHHHSWKRNQYILHSLGRSPSLLSRGFNTGNSNDFFPVTNSNQRSSSSRSSNDAIIYNGPMQDRSGSSNRSHHTNFYGTGVVVVPWIATTISSSSLTTTPATSGCWSVLIFLLLSTVRSIHGGSNWNASLYPPSRRLGSWGSTTIPTAATTTATAAAITITSSMSGYSMLFADAFHPSASYSSKDSESENKNGNDNQESSNSSEEALSEAAGNETETNTLPDAPKPKHNGDEEEKGSTCDAAAAAAATTNDNDNSKTKRETMGRSHPDHDRLLLFHYDSTPSTQDEAKKIAHRIAEASFPAPDTFCVTATSQSSGRGTTGRQWLGAPGNVFVTIGIPVDVWMTRMMKERQIPLTLLPLKIGDLTASLVRKQLDECGFDIDAGDSTATVTVKWPNDVLVDRKKISGTLIENASDWFLIGVGINIAHAPTVPTTGTDYGRPSVSLNDYCGSVGAEEECDVPRESDEEQDLRDQKARELGVQLALDFHRWIYEDSKIPLSADSIVEGWKRWLDWNAELTMRNDDDPEGPRRVVRLLDVLPDGRIRVANKGDGKEEILVSDYFV